MGRGECAQLAPVLFFLDAAARCWPSSGTSGRVP